jgi:glycyl-tRNA synthetase beta chain
VGRDFLLEIGCEELPASFVGPALADLEDLARQGLAEARLDARSVRTLGTPRRLALLVQGLAERQEDRVREVLGPAVKVAFDGSGQPTGAARGFAKGAGVAVEALERTTTPKGEYLLARVHDAGRAAADVLPELARAWTLGLRFPKTMHWSGDARFARPVRWLVALLGPEVLAFESFGLRSGRRSRGHRAIAPDWFEIAEAGGYADALAARGVMVDPAARGSAIEGELRRAAEEIRGTAVPDSELVEEVSNLVEWPEAVLGSFDAKYLELPRAVVVTAMRAHQRYFAIESSGGGAILPHFVMIRNGRGGDTSEIRRGSQGVLRARLEDARFYWVNDLKGGLEAKLPALKGIVWHEKLGTVYDRTQRLTQITEELARILDPRARAAASRAAYLCKADLASEMVRSGKEFASLQGIIGAEYAARAGEPEAVVEAIRSHYLPQGPSDPLPPTVEGKLLSLADRLEAAVGGFRAGLEVSGSQDPYGLRRAGNGIVRILLETGWRLDVLATAAWLEGVFDKAGVPKPPAAGFEPFWAQRMESALVEAGSTPETCAAVLAVRPGDPVDLLARARAIDAIRRSPDFEGLMIGYRRAANILRSAPPEDVPAPGQPLAERAEAFVEPVEADLHLETKMARQAVETYLQASNSDYTSALKHLLGLRPAIDKFFETVMVMADDTPSRRRRLGLLEAVRQTFLRIADFAALPSAPG